MGNKTVGNFIDFMGTGWNLPEWNISEKVAGGNTAYTGSTPDNRAQLSWVVNNPGTNVVNPKTGEVLGASTGTLSPNLGTPTYKNITSTSTSSNPTQQVNNPNPEPQQPSGPSEADLINEAYGNYFKSLDDQMNSLSGYQSQQEGYIGNQYNEMAGQSEKAYNRNENQLKGYETEATQNKATSIRDIGQDLMNSLQAGQIYLGTMGAGSSSAVGRMSEALSKSANRRTTDVSNQTNKILADINTQKMNLKSVYEDEMSKLLKWKNDSINQVAQWVQGQRQSITDARGRMDFQRAQEINNFAIQKLQYIQAKQDNFATAVQEWALSRSNNIAELQKNMTALGSFNVPGLQYTNLSNQYTTTPTSGKYNYFGKGSDEEKLV